jgi:hypothetical protein
MRTVPPLDIAKGELEENAKELEHLRGLSDRERGSILVAACRAASKLEQARAKLGLPQIPPDSWPPSTWELLRKQSANEHGS